MKERWKELMGLYGRLALFVYVSLCLVSFAGSFFLLRAGMENLLPQSLLERIPTDGTTFFGAYALYKLLMVPRIGLAVLVTPIVARLLGRAPAAPEPAAPAEA